MAGPSQATVKRLFTLAGNRCAFPECQTPIVHDSGEVTGEICHIRAKRPKGPRHDPSQSDVERHAYENLFLMCATHHKIVDGKPEIYTVELLLDMKAHAEAAKGRPERAADEFFARILLAASAPGLSLVVNNSKVAIDSLGAIQADTLILRTSRKTLPIKPPSGTIGADADKLSFVRHLIDRYNEFAMRDTSRTREFSHGAIYGTIKSKFGCQLNLVPVLRFEELCHYLEWRISRTRVAKSQASRGHPTFSTFEAYLAKYRK